MHWSYGGAMAQVGGRNRAMSWVAGVFCAGVIVALLWLAMPMGPLLIEYAGDTLRAIVPGER